MISHNGKDYRREYFIGSIGIRKGFTEKVTNPLSLEQWVGVLQEEKLEEGIPERKKPQGHRPCYFTENPGAAQTESK